jgi:hypothetical protein
VANPGVRYPGVGSPKVVFDVLSYYLLVILFCNIVRLIMEITERQVAGDLR